MIKRIFGVFLLLVVFSFSAKAGDLGIQGQCHDGTAFEYRLNTKTCHSFIGMSYIISRAADFCSKQCAAWSGKCAINKMNNIVGDCEDPEVMYQGFDVTCQDGHTYSFNTCSLDTNFASLAERICDNRVHPDTGDMGVMTYTRKSPCN